MKSLKKTLSLVLVLVMVLGMFGIASATNYTDDADIQYKEAVAVMTGLGAIEGYTNDANAGKFLPKGTITRAEAAKMATYTLIGPTAAAALVGVTSRYTDMGNDKWAIPYVEYLSSVGAVEGVGGGKYNPKGNVTGYEYGKILLAGIGYGSQGEFSGSDWTLNVAVFANRPDVGIYKDRAAGASALSAAATREECALYSFNVLFAENVKYSAILGTYNYTGSSLAPSTRYGSNPVINTVASTYPTLKDDVTETDTFGRPAKVWTYGALNTPISTTTATPVATYTTPVTQHTLYTVTGTGTINGFRSTSAGRAAETFTAAFNQTGTGVEGSAYGVVTEVYKVANTNTPATDFRVVQIVPSLASVTSVRNVPATAVSGAYTEYLIGGTAYKVFTSVVDKTLDVNTISIKGAITKGSPILIYKDSKGVLYAESLATIEGVLTAVNGTSGALTIDGKVYAKASYGAAVAPSKDKQTFLVDSYGYIVQSITPQTAGVPYGMAIQTKTMATQGTDGSITLVPTVVVVTADGTVASLPVTTATMGTIETAIGISGSQKGVLVSYVLTTSGTYNVNVPVADDDALAKVTNIDKGVNALTATGITGGAKTVYADAKTVFVVANFNADGNLTGTVTTYTGIANVPSFSGLTDSYAVDTDYVVSVAATDNVANVVFIGKNTTGGASAQMVYVTGSYNTTVAGKVYDVIINGQMDTITVANTASLTKGLYATISVTSSGVPSQSAELLIASTKTGFRASGGLLYTTTDNTTWGVDAITNAADTTPVFIISASAGTCTTTTAAAAGEVTYAKVFVAPAGTSGVAATTAAAIFVLVA